MKKFLNRIKLILKEILNIATNILVPIASVVVIVLEVIPGVPLKWIESVKFIEYWLFYFAGTIEQIQERLEEIEEKE